MKLQIPGDGELELKTLILDLNGTITVRGKLIEGVQERLGLIKDKGLEIFLFSGDTRGTAANIAQQLGIEIKIALNGEDKQKIAEGLEPATCVAIGNGLIDVPLFQKVGLAIAVLQAEGLHRECLEAADIIVPSILDALDLLIDEPSLIATLRP
jgi:soluble P-type ATPase